MTIPVPPPAVLRRFARACPGARDLPVHRPPHAAVARVWILGGEWVLRARDGGPGVQSAFAREQALLEAVRPLVPWDLPEALAADDGRRRVVHGGALWTLHRALPGRVRRTWQDLHRAPDDERRGLLEALRELHDRTAGRLAAPAGAPRDWLACSTSGRLEALAPRLSPRALARCRAALGGLAGRRAARTAFVHGDFHWGNLLVDGEGRPVSLVDLDWCRVGDPVEDLAYTAMMLVRDGEGRPARLEDLPRLQAWYGLAPGDRDAFADAFLLCALFDVHLFLEAAALPHRTAWARRQVALLEQAAAVL